VTGASQRSLARDCRSALADLPAEWALTPVKGKRPYRLRWNEEPPVDRELVVEEIERGHATGYALRTGSVSGGVFALDEDGPGALALLGREPGELLPTPEIATGLAGHRHRFFRVSEERWSRLRYRTVFPAAGGDPSDTKISLRFGSMISNLPPAMHPSGRRYEWAPGLGPAGVALAPAPPELLEQSEYAPGEAESIVEAAWRGDAASVEAALRDGSADAPAPDGYTALLRAAWGGRATCARVLLDAGADPRRRDPFGRPVLSLAAELGDTDVMALLIAAGAEVDAPDGGGRTPLHYASWGGHDAAVEALLEAGARRDRRDGEGREPADVAREWGYRELAERRLDRAQPQP